ncbi:MAG: hypothetical protein ABH811_01315 [archaeon]
MTNEYSTRIEKYPHIESFEKLIELIKQEKDPKTVGELMDYCIDKFGKRLIEISIFNNQCFLPRVY